MRVELASRGRPKAEALRGPGGYENIILRAESQELSIRNRISEEMAHSEVEALERDVRHTFLYQDPQFKLAVREYPRQARDAVNQAVGESPENYEIMRKGRKCKKGGTSGWIRSTRSSM